MVYFSNERWCKPKFNYSTRGSAWLPWISNESGLHSANTFKNPQAVTEVSKLVVSETVKLITHQSCNSSCLSATKYFVLDRRYFTETSMIALIWDALEKILRKRCLSKKAKWHCKEIMFVSKRWTIMIVTKMRLKLSRVTQTEEARLFGPEKGQLKFQYEWEGQKPYSALVWNAEVMKSFHPRYRMYCPSYLYCKEKVKLILWVEAISSDAVVVFFSSLR